MFNIGKCHMGGNRLEVVLVVVWEKGVTPVEGAIRPSDTLTTVSHPEPPGTPLTFAVNTYNSMPN